MGAIYSFSTIHARNLLNIPLIPGMETIEHDIKLCFLRLLNIPLIPGMETLEALFQGSCHRHLLNIPLIPGMETLLSVTYTGVDLHNLLNIPLIPGMETFLNHPSTKTRNSSF